MIALLAAIASQLITLAGAVIRPTSATCPAGSWLAEGVRPSSAFACRFDPMADDTDTAPRGVVDRPTLRLRLWCSGDTYPRVDGVRVWCAAGRMSS